MEAKNGTKAVTVIMDDRMHEAALVVLKTQGMTMSGFVRRQLLGLIMDWAVDHESHQFDDVIDRHHYGDKK